MALGRRCSARAQCRGARLAAVTAGLACASAADRTTPPPIALNVSAHWNDDPGTTGDDRVRAVGRLRLARPLQDLLPASARSDRDRRRSRLRARTHRGDCEWDMLLVVTGVPPDAPVDVQRLQRQPRLRRGDLRRSVSGFGASADPRGRRHHSRGEPGDRSASDRSAVIRSGYRAGRQFHWLDTPPRRSPSTRSRPAPAAPDGTIDPGSTAPSHHRPREPGRSRASVRRRLHPRVVLRSQHLHRFTSCIATAAIRTSDPCPGERRSASALRRGARRAPGAR